jgi:hypothetical protein
MLHNLNAYVTPAVFDRPIINGSQSVRADGKEVEKNYEQKVLLCRCCLPGCQSVYLSNLHTPRSARESCNDEIKTFFACLPLSSAFCYPFLSLSPSLN